MNKIAPPSFRRDDIYDQPQPVVDFSFDERTAAVFPDMIHRSVPGYATLLQLLGVVGAQFVPAGGKVYDLGCSLGGAGISLQRFIPADAKIEAVDLSPAMVARFAAYIAGAGIKNIEVYQKDISSMTFSPASLMILNFTLQFIAREQRQALLKRIYQALQPGGALLLAEKTTPMQERMRLWHEAFKAAQGYSEMAIARKRESLENVMQTDNQETIIKRLHRAGFQQIELYFQALQFCAWIAIK